LAASRIVQTVSSWLTPDKNLMSYDFTVIVKLAERCNLACPYCYMYNGADESWRSRPKRLSMDLAEKVVERSREFLDDYPDVHLTLEFHGGEPLLFGLANFRSMMQILRRELPSDRCTICLQTNGVLLNQEWCDCFQELDVHWSISCDGPVEVHNMFRHTSRGKGSHAAVERAISLSLSQPRQRELFGGVLAVINTGASGTETVRYFHDLGVRHLDLLLPDATHLAPPAHLPGFSQDRLLGYLRDAFDAWTALDNPRFHIRTFEHIIGGIFGTRPQLDAFGGGTGWLMVVESDGSYQNLDVLHICGEEFTSTDGHLCGRSFGDHFNLTRREEAPLCAVCASCQVVDLCGGGYLPHRFDGGGFDNPSVHCYALKGIITHVHEYLARNTPISVWSDRAATNDVHALQ
jgi:uncharacterized protein